MSPGCGSVALDATPAWPNRPSSYPVTDVPIDTTASAPLAIVPSLQVVTDESSVTHLPWLERTAPVACDASNVSSTPDAGIGPSLPTRASNSTGPAGRRVRRRTDRDGEVGHGAEVGTATTSSCPACPPALVLWVPATTMLPSRAAAMDPPVSYRSGPQIETDGAVVTVERRIERAVGREDVGHIARVRIQTAGHGDAAIAEQGEVGADGSRRAAEWVTTWPPSPNEGRADRSIGSGRPWRATRTCTPA